MHGIEKQRLENKRITNYRGIVATNTKLWRVQFHYVIHGLSKTTLKLVHAVAISGQQF